MRKRERSETSVEELRRQAARRARAALGRFGNGVAHVVLRPRGRSAQPARCRTMVGVMRFGALSIEEALA